MAICNGDLNQYEILKRMSVGDYLVKLEDHMRKIKTQDG